MATKWCPEIYHKDCVYRHTCGMMFNEFSKRMAESKEWEVDLFDSLPECHSIHENKEVECHE